MNECMKKGMHEQKMNQDKTCFIKRNKKNLRI